MYYFEKFLNCRYLDYWKLMVSKYQGINVPFIVIQEFKTITDYTATAIIPRIGRLVVK